MTYKAGACRCGREWASLTQAHCVGCHEHFASVGVSDWHQSAGSPCVHPSEVRKKNGAPRYRLSHEADGPVWRTADRFDAEEVFEA